MVSLIIFAFVKVPDLVLTPTNDIFSLISITFIDNVPCLQILRGGSKSGGIEQKPL